MSKKFPKLKNKAILAPMYRITNLPFRLLCKKHGASLVSTGMLSANAIARKNKAALKLALTDQSEKPVVAQLFGQNMPCIINAAKILEKNFDIIDFNCGCPSERILSQGSGGALLTRKNKIKEIIKNLINAVEIPVTVKLRSGINNKKNAIEIAKICEQAGASAITIHARLVEQNYKGKIDLELIKKIKKAVKIPVIGKGDIRNGEDAQKMLELTNCDYIMVGRAAIGNPFIFKEINYYLKFRKKIKQKKEDKIKDFFEYITLCKKFKIFSITDAKLRAQEFTKGLKRSSCLRKKLTKAKKWEEIKNLMNSI